MGQDLGSLNITLMRGFFYIWLVLILISPFKTSNDEDKIKIDIKHKCCFGSLFLLIAFLSLLAMAISFTPIGWPQIEGVQGRYFFPALPLLIVLLANLKLNFSNLYNKVFIFFVSLMQGVTILNILFQVLN